MSEADFRRSIDFIAGHVLPRLGVGRGHWLTSEFLGGEVLVLPPEELEANVRYARSVLGHIVGGYKDGAQSNLLASDRRVLALHDLFDGRIGTSWDGPGGKRRLAGSAERYKVALDRSLTALRTQRNMNPGRVLVLDRDTVETAPDEVRSAIAQGTDLVLRPVFRGGSPGIEPATVGQLTRCYLRCFEIWSQNPSSTIEPFHGFLLRRRARGQREVNGAASVRAHSGCPFQFDCARRSLSLDPDGSLHICQEMADAGHYRLGNAITGTFSDPVWRLLARRTLRLSSDCMQCPWISECGGGCMNEAIEATGDPFARTELCPVWMSIFERLDQHLANGRLSIVP